VPPDTHQHTNGMFGTATPVDMSAAVLLPFISVCCRRGRNGSGGCGHPAWLQALKTGGVSSVRQH